MYFLVKSKTNLSTNWKTKLKQGAKWRLKQYVERKGKERKNRYAKLIEVDEEELYTLKINCNGRRTVKKANKGINVQKM